MRLKRLLGTSNIIKLNTDTYLHTCPPIQKLCGCDVKVMRLWYTSFTAILGFLLMGIVFMRQ